MRKTRGGGEETTPSGGKSGARQTQRTDRREEKPIMGTGRKAKALGQGTHQEMLGERIPEMFLRLLPSKFLYISHPSFLYWPQCLRQYLAHQYRQ